MTDVQLNDSAIHEWARESSELREALRDLAEEIAGVARMAAPVSPRGSFYSPPGWFKSMGFGAEVVEASDGLPYAKATELQYPGNFLGNRALKTRNANQYGHYGYRPATRLFLKDAALAKSALFSDIELKS